MVKDKINMDNKLTSMTSSDSMTSTEEFPSRSASASNSQAVEMETVVDEPQSISTSNSNSTPDSTSTNSNSAPSRKRFSVDAFKFNFRNRKNSQANQNSSDKNKKEDKLVQESQQHTLIAASLSQPQSSVEHQIETQDGKNDGKQDETNNMAVGDEQKETLSKEIKESESAASEESPIIPNRSTSTSNKQRRTRSSSFSTSSSPSKQILAFKFPSFTSQKPSSSPSKRSPYSNQNHSVSVPALVTSTSHGPSRQELARSSGLPIRRVSFSPSIDEALEAREEALAHLEQLRRESTEELIRDWDREDKKKSLKEEKERKKLERKEMKLKRRESGEGKKLKGSTSTSSSDKKVDDKDVESVATTINKDSQFTWDQDGIHSPKERRRRPSKAKVSKRQAIAARHARILEHVINGGTGLSSTEPIPSHPSSDHQQPSSKKNKNKKNEGKNPTIPLATSQELNQLKKALMDANIANGIIGELRAMKLPVKASGLVEHQERVLVSDEKMVLKEDEKKEDQDAATTTTEVPFDPFNRPQLHRSQSEAELALRKVGSRDVEAQAQIEDTTTDSSLTNANHHKKFHFGNFRRRTSSNASSKPESSHAIPIPLKACALSHSDSQAHHHHIHNGPDELKKFKQRHEDAIKNSHQEASKKEMATVAAVGVGGIGLWNWWNSSSKKDSSTIPQEIIDGTQSQVPAATSIETQVQIQAKEVEVEEEEGIFSLNSLDLPQVPNLPYGVSPISLIMSPTSTAITASASASGAFDMMASVSGAAIRASGTDLNIQPPLDRMAIFVHWWGFEITIPKASMKFLSTAQSVSGAFMGFLSTMCVSGGVPELLPFVKYISMYMDVEFKAIQQQDKGDGVVVAATWFMPLGLVPRPWDYPLSSPPVSNPTPTPAPSNPPTSQEHAGSIPTGILIPPTPTTSLPILPMQALSTPSLSRTPSNGSTSSSLRSESPVRNGSSPPRTPAASQILAVANAQKEGISPLGNVEELMLEKGRKKNKTVALEILEELPEGSVRIKA